jgi:hypothetical protein
MQMQQDPKNNANSFEKDLGLELLMNPKKRLGSDAVSLSSRSSFNDDKISVKSGSIRSIEIRPDVIDVGNHINMNQDDDDEYETETDDVSYESEMPSQLKNNGGDRRSKFQQQYQQQQQGGDNTSDEGSQLESLGSIMHEQRRRLSDEDILIMKKEMLYQFERLEKKGMKLPKKFTLSSSLEEMKAEFERLKRDRAIDSSVKLQRRMMMAVVSGVEWCNSKFDPIGAKLDGWSDSVYENIDDYDDVFEELYDKYKGKANFPPEIKLLMLLGGSGFMFHMTNSMFKSQLPGLNDILKQNPELARNLAAATSSHMAQQQSGANNLFGNLGGMFSNFFGGGGQQQQQQAQPDFMNHSPPPYIPVPPMQNNRIPQQYPSQQQQQRVNMKGPSNVEDLLREFENNNIDNDRIEAMSSIAESELDALTADDSSSINGILMGKKKNKGKKGRTLNL